MTVVTNIKSIWDKIIPDCPVGSTHPVYQEMIEDWVKYRYTYNGGQDFIDEYTEKFSKREDDAEFLSRRNATYCPAHAKVAINEIKDAISERLIDVERLEGPVTYQNAVRGLNGGVDGFDSTMNGFIRSSILPDLLALGKVGVYVDREALPSTFSKAIANKYVPYLYTYGAEDLLNWKYENGLLTALLLRDWVYAEDEATGLPKGTKSRFRFYKLENGFVSVTFYDDKGEKEEGTEEGTRLSLPMIPFVTFHIEQSLMTDIANYQIALLNLGSSDLNYAIKSNFPFYTEQYDPKDMMVHMLQGSPDGTSDEANTAKRKELEVGVAQGRKYPKGLDRPDFIHPSPDPLTASMLKQEKLQEEIRRLVRLSVQSLPSSSEASKKMDARSVESGLASIGSELERGERQVGVIWANYTKEKAPTIIYPNSYTLKTQDERISEATELEKHITLTPSTTMKKELTKQVADILISHKVPSAIMEKIHNEIDNAEVITTDPEVIRLDHEAGLVGTGLASKLRGYPEGEVEQAKIDHAERIKRIALAQSEAGARGIADMDSENNTAKNEKKLSQSADMSDDGSKKVRGDG